MKKGKARGAVNYKPSKVGAKMAKDPICEMEVDEKTAKYSTVKKGKKYYFCSENCYKEFTN